MPTFMTAWQGYMKVCIHPCPYPKPSLTTLELDALLVANSNPTDSAKNEDPKITQDDLDKIHLSIHPLS
jgi:hypothetical protein